MWGGPGRPLGDAYRSAARDGRPARAGRRRGEDVPTAGVSYPTDWPAADLADALKDTAQLIKADVGTDVVSIDFGSWDMHSDYGTAGWGQMQSMTGGFAGCSTRSCATSAPLRSRVTVVTISEFGRRIRENGNRGLDHGWGNMMLVAGGGVKGGRTTAAGRASATATRSTTTCGSPPTTATSSARSSPAASPTARWPGCSRGSATRPSA